MRAALLGSAGILIILLNVWLVPRRTGFRRRYAQRGILIGAVMVVAAIYTAIVG